MAAIPKFGIAAMVFFISCMWLKYALNKAERNLFRLLVCSMGAVLLVPPHTKTGKMSKFIQPYSGAISLLPLYATVLIPCNYTMKAACTLNQSNVRQQ